MPKRSCWVNWALAGTIVICLVALVGCGAPQPIANSTVALTSAPTNTPTALPATPTVTLAPATTATFACPAASAGSGKVFSDSAMRFSFSYPAAWTETSCQRFTGNDGQQTLFIGNLFSVSIMPRSGQSIQQWVNTQTNQYETVTLGALTDTQAQAAATVSAAPSAITDPNKPFDAEPFWSTFAIVAGSHSIYMVNGFIAQMSMTDTIPNLSRQQLAQQVVSTFIVP